MEEQPLHIVIAGHVDHGKSTLVGRLYYDTGSLPPEKMEEIRRISEDLGKEMEFAFIMDHLEEERAKGITIDVAHTFFQTEKRRYVIIDAPGHKEFLKNMITGSSQAEAALLLVDAAQGVQEQTKRHCFILGLLGIRQIAVLINKMDSVAYSQETFRKVEAEITRVLTSFNIRPAFVIPTAARLGENVARRTGSMAWYSGPTVLEALDRFNPLVVEEKDLRFPIQDVYNLDRGPVYVGRVEAGALRKGKEVWILPEKSSTTISEILKFGEEDLSTAPTGDCVGVRVAGRLLKRGEVVVDRLSSRVSDTLRATIFWMVDQDYRLGIPLTWKGTTQDVPCKIEKILKRFDPASIESVEENASEIKPAEVAEVEIRLDRPVVTDSFTEIPEMGRFVLEHLGHPVAGGIVV